MADRDEMALSYLLPPSLSFWHWQDRGDAVAWIDGGTIAFREALILVLERLAPRGLPPLGCVLLLLAACRDNWREGRRETGRIDGIPLPLTVPRQQERERTQIAGVVAALDRIHTFDRRYRTNIEMVAVMAELVFENAAVRTMAETSQTVIAALRAGIIADVSDVHSLRAEPQPSFDSEMRILLDGLPLITEEAIEARLRRGVEQDLTPVPLDLPPAERVRRLIDDLQSDVELSGVARLARKLLAALSVLRPVSAPDELALGGVSDITNRGPLDRLLLSELAHDDLTLATRIAMGEALYLRREAPPSDPPAVRSILIDAGLRLWGIPRLYAAAVGMAFSAVDRTVDVTAFRASCNKLVPVDLATRAGLLAHLEALEPELHPGAALAPFRAHLDETDETLEPILITHADTLDDADFRQSLASSRFAVLWIASLDHTGSFSLHSFTKSGRKLLREARFSLDDILEPAKQPTKLVAPMIDPAIVSDLPLIFSVRPFPLRLPVSFKPGRPWRTSDGGGIAITNDRRLVHWNNPAHGAIQLAERLPANKLFFVNTQGSEDHFLLIAPPEGGQLHVAWVNLAGSRWEITAVDREIRNVHHACGIGDEVLIVHGWPTCQLTVLRRSFSDYCQTSELSQSMEWVGGRYFYCRSQSAYFAAVLNSGMPILCRITEDRRTKLQHGLLFDVDGEDETYAATTDDIINVRSRQCLGLDVLLSSHVLVGYSQRGRGRVIVRGLDRESGKRTQIVWNIRERRALSRISLKDGPALKRSAEPIRFDRDFLLKLGDPFWVAEDIPQPSILRSGLSKRFRTIGIDQSNRTIVLGSQSGEYFQFAWFPTPSALQLVRTNAVPTHETCFANRTLLGASGIELREANWRSEGCRAYLDSRGLLHLGYHSAGHPQVSMVLSADCVSGWCSDGRTFGDSFFIGDCPVTISANEIFDTVIHLFVRKVAGC